MKKRNLWFILLMSLLTLGIYQYYWAIATKLEINRKGGKIPTIFLPFLPFLGLAIVVLVQLFVFSLNQDSGNWMVDVLNALSLLIGVGSIIAFFVLIIYWVYRYGKEAEVVTKGKVPFDLTFWSAVVLGVFSLSFLWPLLIQYHFNKVRH